jgi:hypothetical protein
VLLEDDRSELKPLPLVTEHDDRPDVRDLIEQHKKMIDQIRENLRGHAAV